MSDRLDQCGAIASTACAIHCAVSAFLPAALGALGLGALMGHEAEWAFTMLAVGLASFALVQGWRRHRSVLVAGLLALGIAGLLASRGLEMGAPHAEHGHTGHVAGTMVGVMAGLLLLFGHVLNVRRSRQCAEEGCS